MKKIILIAALFTTIVATGQDKIRVLSSSTEIITISGPNKMLRLVDIGDDKYNLSFKDENYSEIRAIAGHDFNKEDLKTLAKCLAMVTDVKPQQGVSTDSYTIEKRKSGFGGYIYFLNLNTVFERPALCKLWPAQLEKLRKAIDNL